MPRKTKVKITASGDLVMKDSEEVLELGDTIFAFQALKVFLADQSTKDKPLRPEDYKVKLLTENTKTLPAFERDTSLEVERYQVTISSTRVNDAVLFLCEYYQDLEIKGLHYKTQITVLKNGDLSLIDEKNLKAGQIVFAEEAVTRFVADQKSKGRTLTEKKDYTFKFTGVGTFFTRTGGQAFFPKQAIISSSHAEEAIVFLRNTYPGLKIENLENLKSIQKKENIQVNAKEDASEDREAKKRKFK